MGRDGFCFGSPIGVGGEGEFWRVEATPGVIPRLLRLTVSLWTLPSPGWSLEAFFWK